LILDHYPGWKDFDFGMNSYDEDTIIRLMQTHAQALSPVSSPAPSPPRLPSPPLILNDLTGPVNCSAGVQVALRFRGTAGATMYTIERSVQKGNPGAVGGFVAVGEGVRDNCGNGCAPFTEVYVGDDGAGVRVYYRVSGVMSGGKTVVGDANEIIKCI
jgi:hypothetical protein